MPRQLISLLGIAGVSLTLLLTSCTVGPDYKQPTADMPGSYGETAPADAAARTASAKSAARTPTTSAQLDRQQRAQRATTQPVDLSRWWASFNDTTLDALVRQAIDGNLDLRAATARILQARASRSAAAAAFWPELDASAGYTHESIGKNAAIAFGGGSGSAASGGGASAAIPTNQAINLNLYNAGFDATWEVDVFGGTRRNIEAATYDLQASIEDRRDVLVTLLGEVAVNYVELRAAQRELAITQQNLQSQRDTLELTRSRYSGGIGTDLDVARAEGQVATTEADIPPLQIAIKQAIHSLSVLTGREPNALAAELAAPAQNIDVPEGSPQVPVGLPSDLLRRRPDVRRAERQLAAATARIGVATADLFPKFSLTGAVTQESTQVHNLFDAASFGWSVGPSVTWDIFDFNRVRSNVEVQNQLTSQALTAYQMAILNSLSDVANSLVAYDRELARRVSLAHAVDANRRAADLVREQYARGGIIDFLSVLDAERAVFAAELELIQSDSAVSRDLVSLYKALGGGWEMPIATTRPGAR